jgi:hypothetical protein
LPRLIVLSVAVLAATGCATTTYVAALPNVSANCVDTLQAVTARPLGYLPTEAKARKAALQPVEFATVSTCLRGADAGPVPVALYRFDGVAAPAEVNVAVTLSPGGTFAAKVEVLDAMLQPVQSYGFDKFTRRGSTYSLNVFLNDTNRQPGYLLISPDRAQVGKSDTIVGSQTNAVVIPTGGAIYYGTETMTVRPFLEGGMVLVTAQPQVSAGFTSDAR